MLRLQVRGRRAKVLGAATVAAVVAAGLAVAAIPGPDGTITGCYSNTNGSLRVIDAAFACATGETRLTWNRTGPRGPTGPAGPVGAQGPTGPAGPAVLAGAVDFVDAADATGFVGPSGQAQVAPTALSGDAILPIGGTLDKLRVAATLGGTSGTVKLTVLRNDVATTVTCTITAPATSCSDTSRSRVFATGDRLTVRVENSTGNSVRFLRWTAQYP